MKRFRDIQILLFFFTAFFLASGIALIVVFQTTTWIAASIALACFVGTWLMARSLLTLNGYFHSFKQREARLMLLASRDPATGLFQRNGFEWLLTKEIERAKRKDFSLTLTLIQVEPFKKIEADIGIPATERLLFQIGESLQNTCRAYDNLFKLDTNTFALFFTETQNQDLEKIVKRLQRRLQKTAFLVNSDRVKITPLFKIGAGVYPIDGTNPQSLEAFARANLSEAFDVSHIRHPEKNHSEIFEVVPTVKPLESPVAKDSLQIKTLTQPIAPVFTKQDIFIESVIEPTATKPQFLENQTASQFESISTQNLQGTPEMDAFQTELKSLFARTHAIEESVQKLLVDEPKVQPPKANNLKPLNLEPLPAGLSYFQQLSKKTEVVQDDVAATIDATLHALVPDDTKIVAPEASVEMAQLPEEGASVSDYSIAANDNTNATEQDDAAWSVDDLANMPDVVAALMQNDIHESVATKHNPVIERRATPARVQKIEIIQNGNEPIIQVDFQK